MNQGESNGRKWFTALMLSPGMLFTAAYLVVWMSTNFYLHHRFREQLTRTFDAAAGSRYRLSVGDLGTSLDLNSLTLKHLELTPVSPRDKARPEPIRIEKIDFACPEIGLFLFRPSSVEVTTRQLSRQLLIRCRVEALSMNEKPHPSPADR